MADRLQLQAEFEKLKETDGVETVKFQPPASVKLIYPAIIYNLNRYFTRNADNIKYVGRRQYIVTVIHRDPDSKIAEHIMKAFPYVSFDRRYVVDNLYHDVLTLYW